MARQPPLPRGRAPLTRISSITTHRRQGRRPPTGSTAQRTSLTSHPYWSATYRHGRPKITIESAFSPVRARTRVTKGPGTRDTGLAMVFKLLQAAEGNWRAVNGPHLVALVRAGAKFEKGKLIERPDHTPRDEEAAQDVTKVAA